MSEENIGFFAAFWRFFTFYRLRKALGLIRAADRQFTGSVQGISDAFDIQHHREIQQFKGLRDAVAEVEGVLEDKRTRLEQLNKEEMGLLDKREGALSMAEKAKAVNNTADYEKWAAAFERYQTRIGEIEKLQTQLEQEIAETGRTMEKYMLQLTEMQARIQHLPEEKAQAIADHVSAKKILELNDRLLGLQSSLERGPIEAVLKHNRELTAKARISEKMAGTDVRLQDQELAREGSKARARNLMEDMLAARQAERGSKSNDGVVKTPEIERPKI